MSNTPDHAAPMAAAPIKYTGDGTVDWGNMWDSFCVLAREGGPAHRPTLLEARPDEDGTSAAYRSAAAEICRAVPLVSGLHAVSASPGWIAIDCPSAEAAQWLAESMIAEGVTARAEAAMLLVPCSADFTLKGEIKSVVTAVAKTTHYYADHLPNEVKIALRWQRRLAQLRERLPWRRIPAAQRPAA